MATLTTISGYLYDANGAIVTVGKLTLRLQQDMTSVDGTKIAPFAIEHIITGTSGFISLAIVPTDGASPAGLAYVVEYDPDETDTTQPARTKDGYWQNYWAVPNTGTAPLGIFVTASRGVPLVNYVPLSAIALFSTITSITAGVGLSGGGTTGTVNIDIESQADPAWLTSLAATKITGSFGTLSATTGSFGTLSATGNGIAVTSTDGIVTANNTLATAGVPVQQSPRLRLRANVWNTTTPANNTDDWFVESVPISAATPSGLLKFGKSLNGGAATFPLTLTSGGALSITSDMNSLGNVQAGGAGGFSWAGRSWLLSPANGQLNITNNAITAGIGFDVATDGTLKVRTRAQAGYAAIQALTFLAEDGTAAAPSISFSTVPTSGLYLVGAANPGMASAGVGVMQWINGNIQVASGQAFTWASGLLNSASDLKLSRVAAGQLNLTATTNGVGFDVATDAVLKVRTRAQTGDASLTALNLTASNEIKGQNVFSADTGYIGTLSRSVLSFPANATMNLLSQAVANTGVGLDFATDGTLKMRNRAQTAPAALWAGANAIAVTSTDGILIANDTASTAGVPLQQSPRLRLRSHVWNTTATAADNTNDWFIESVPVSGTTPYGSLNFVSSLNGAAGLTKVSIDSFGQVVASTYVAAATGQIYWVGRALMSTPAAGQLNVTNTAGTSGIGFDVATDGTLKIRTPAQTGDASLTALNITASGVFAGSGASLTALPAAQLVGSVAVAALPIAGTTSGTRGVVYADNLTITVDGAGKITAVGSAANSVAAVDGAAATPSISFASDGDTGFYSAGANSLGLTVAGVSRWTFGVNAAFTGTLAGDGSLLTALNATNLASGTVGTARLGTGTANSGSFLRGDGTWAAAVAGTYVFTQVTPATSWVITHGLGAKGVNVIITDASDVVIIPDSITYTTTTATVTFGVAQAGLAYCQLPPSGAVGLSTNAASLTSGTVATARLGSGTADATTFLRGDSTWVTGIGTTDASLLTSGTLATARRVVVQADAATGTANDFALTANVTTLRCTNATLRTYTGFVAGVAGQRFTIIATVGQVDVTNQDAASSANNRCINNVTGKVSVVAGGSMTFEYDITTLRWRVIAHAQGGPIAHPYSSGDYTATTGTWTVDSGDVLFYTYVLDAMNKALTVNFNFNTTSVSAATPSLIALIPGGYTGGPSQADNPGFYGSDDGSSFFNGMMVRVSAAGTTLGFFKTNIANWAISTNVTVVRGVVRLVIS